MTSEAHYEHVQDVTDRVTARSDYIMMLHENDLITQEQVLAMHTDLYEILQLFHKDRLEYEI